MEAGAIYLICFWVCLLFFFSPCGRILVRKTNQSQVLPGVTLRGGQTGEAAHETPKLLLRNFDIDYETPRRIDGKQTDQSNVSGDAAAPACPTGCDAQAASRCSGFQSGGCTSGLSCSSCTSRSSD